MYRKLILCLIFTFPLLNAAGQEHEVLGYEELQKFLPEEIEGFVLEGEKDGATITFGDAKYSTASADYINGSSKEELSITIMDYSNVPVLYQTTSLMWTAGISVETPDEYAKSIQLGSDIVGWEVYEKKFREATLTLGVKNRYIVVIEGRNHENTDVVKIVAEKLNLSDLP